jgi:hypothetical protein
MDRQINKPWADGSGLHLSGWEDSTPFTATVEGLGVLSRFVNQITPPSGSLGLGWEHSCSSFMLP